MPSFTLLTLLLVGLSGQVSAQAPGKCAITHVEGEAVVSARGVGRRSAVVGLGLGTNATLRTGTNTRVVMRCSGDLRVVVGPESAITVSGVLEGGRTPLGLRLLNGISGFLLDSNGRNDVQVRTPSAVAAVRSTEWAIQVKDRASAVFARDGRVFVFGQDGNNVQLGPDEGVDVTRSGEVGPVVRWGQARIDNFEALLGPSW